MKNERLKCVIIGAGRVAGKHVTATVHNKKTMELAAIADINLGAAQSLIKNLKVKPRLYTDYIDMIRTERPDIAAITTPSGTHWKIAKDCIENGVNVIIEKPMTLSVKEADELIALAEKHNVKIQLGHIYRFMPAVGDIRGDIVSGKFGGVISGSVSAYWGHGQAYYDSAEWRGTWESDGGALMNQSVHAFDLMCWLTGAWPMSVAGFIARKKHIMEAEDYGCAVIRMENGAYIQLEGTTDTPEDRHAAEFRIKCENADISAGIRCGRPFIRITDARNKNISKRYIFRAARGYIAKYGFSAVGRMKNPHSGLYEDMADAVISNREPLAGGVCGKKAVEAVLAVYKSAKTRAVADIPLKDFDITDMRGYFD